MANFNLQVDKRSDEPISTQIANQFRDAIKGGQLKIGELLPSTPSVAKKLGVSIESVRRAYSKLKEEKLAVSDSTNGTFVGRVPSGSVTPAKSKGATKRKNRVSKRASKQRASKRGGRGRRKAGGSSNQVKAASGRRNTIDRAASILSQQQELEREKKQAIAELIEEKSRIDDQLRRLGFTAETSRRGRPKGSTGRKRKRGRPRKNRSRGRSKES
jgi:DNA-binding transcriptional regulator YhcF (GntR family)